MQILVIEDHAEVRELVTRTLTKEHYDVVAVPTLRDADLQLGRSHFDVIVLDLGLPDGDGLTWCKQVRASGQATPILVLTAQSAVSQRVAGLDAGADDYLGKPFAVAELRARVRALSRRVPAQRTHDVVIGDVNLDFRRRRAIVRGREAPLTQREWRIVELLASSPGNVVARTLIVDRLWDDVTPGAEASLEVLIGRIRKKLGPNFIRTVRGEGYAVG